ncbi:hypothetical protein Taro_049147 [Colocasia esculenta]|uniref:Uncharacterized protein n=1 Tax=Colocasia esculenta TaxID=4460 RepID=A0A843XA42_COLES|nr:hypothetical protein [Colocasia esculenta]
MPITCSDGMSRGCRTGLLAYATVITAPGYAPHHQDDHLHHLRGGALAVEGRLGELQRGGYLMDNNGMSPSSEDMAWALLQITLRVAWALYQKYIHFNGKSLDDAIASVPVGVDSSDWQTMCEMWTTADERSHMHGRTPHRLEVFKMGRCKDLPDGSESWVDEESRRRYEAMTQMIAPSSDIDAESHTPATPDDAFISVMGKDRPGRVLCAGSGETLGTWYRSTGTSASSERERIMQEQLKAQEEKLKAQEEEMTQMREKISRLENVATKVDEMSILLSQIQASQARTQHVPPAGQSGSDSETDEAADDYSDHDDHVS